MVRTDNKANIYAIVYAFLLNFSSIILIKKLKNCYAISDCFCDADDMVHFVAHFEGAQ
ncbi:hypothetical protein MCO_00769 [Bartonella sp. DB5-6]|nr:hypothetical protein MCO_00769 [Bartonella sp. DB5-6]